MPGASVSPISKMGLRVCLIVVLRRLNNHEAGAYWVFLGKRPISGAVSFWESFSTGLGNQQGFHKRSF